VQLVSAARKQALIEAPVEEIWELVGNPSRHSEWWPRVIEVRGERFLEGDQYVQVTRSPTGTVETDFRVEQRSDMREIKLRCQQTGVYARWLLTEAQQSTFVDVEFGMDPATLGNKVFDVVAGRIYFRRWVEQSVEGLKEACTPPGPLD
jgi:hypothetical protein